MQMDDGDRAREEGGGGGLLLKEIGIGKGGLRERNGGAEGRGMSRREMYEDRVW